VLVTSGATEALLDCFLGLLEVGDEVVVLEPAYDTYAPVLRRLGADASVRLAIRHFPFEAHAWTELNGAPVNEAPSVCALYEPFPALDLETLACSR
jgi:histidinol-phosphate/aromatic aminotransferase/cobyric acid decarboxylase-like protein